MWNACIIKSRAPRVLGGAHTPPSLCLFSLKALLPNSRLRRVMSGPKDLEDLNISLPGGFGARTTLSRLCR